MCVHIFMHACANLCVGKRKRDRERGHGMSVCVCVCVSADHEKALLSSARRCLHIFTFALRRFHNQVWMERQKYVLIPRVR
jgi:hypothetical protein